MYDRQLQNAEIDGYKVIVIYDWEKNDNYHNNDKANKYDIYYTTTLQRR